MYKNDLYMKAFLKNIILRPSCYECQNRPIQGNADITLADFWGICAVDSNMYDSKGVSLLITHSRKGQALFENIKKNLIWKEEKLEEAVKYNSSYEQSCKEPKLRRDFFCRLSQKETSCEEFEKMMKRATREEGWRLLRFGKRVFRWIRKCTFRKN